MASSDEGGVRHIGTRRQVLVVVAGVLLAVTLAVALVIGFGYRSISMFQDHAEAQNVDAVEKTFLDNRDGFEATAAYITQLAHAEPDAVRISWIKGMVCVTDAGGQATCRDSTAEEDAKKASAPLARPILWQAKDDGRVFFSFNREEPPMVYLMFDPKGRDAEQFARENGFSWERDLGDGWSIPGSTPHDDDDAMWVDPGSR